MNAYMHALRLRVRDAAHSCWTAAFPSDRPSGAYSIYTCIINGGLLVWSFAVVFSRPCETVVVRWVYAGMAHCFINMMFSVAVMALTRRQIAVGIPEERSQWRVFFSNPIVKVYLLYLVWEFVWMIAVGQLNGRYPHTTCSSHLNVQVAFLAFYLLIGGFLFYSTFTTERCRRPRWRHFSAIRYNDLYCTRSQHSVRWNDERTAVGADGEPVVFDCGAMSHGEGTERTTTLDYASIMDDLTTVPGDGQDDSSRAAPGCRQTRGPALRISASTGTHRSDSTSPPLPIEQSC
ncbi:hypothetical protein MNV84_04123 [Leishmania braziliensis]|nr:hypothetical protein MNV84_04123 [Leishmania braziliensis]